METWQKVLIAVFGIVNAYFLIRGYWECKYKINAYGLTPKLTIFGIFVWGDAVVIGLFWLAVSLAVLIIDDWCLFLLTYCVFWVVRSLGETIYWFNQQFSNKRADSNKPEKMIFHWLFHNDSIWYVYQIGWQCVTVVSVIFSIYFGKMWMIKF